MNFVLTDFQAVRPPHEIAQEKILEWFAEAHAEAERFSQKELPASFAQELKNKVFHYACRADQISQRGSALSDFTHTRWGRMEIYDFSAGAEGKGMAARHRFFSKAVRPVFEKLYGAVEEAPDDLLHVTCTGYLSPSEAQRCVDTKGWNRRTAVTHAYHMGCYAAFPAIRIAAGLLSHPPEFSARGTKKRRADVVHTELCSLHLNPSDHSPEQLVIQSLFADGFVKYSVMPEEGVFRSGLKILSLREETVPQSGADMTWGLSDWGMEMTLSLRVPIYLAQNVRNFLAGLFDQAGMNFEGEKENVRFAVHPGGPLIVDLIQDVLKLQPSQVAWSRRILYQYGNMSSATLPHIWQAMVEDADVPIGTLIVGLAFGPGLTLCGGLFRKI